MADELGDKILDTQANESESKNNQENSYRVRTISGIEVLNSEFKNLILAPFLNSLRNGNELFRLIDKDVYYHFYSIFINRLLQRPQVTVKLAVLSDNTVLGWSMIENQTLHYVWVKKEVQRQGIAKSLIPKDIEAITHLTNKGISVWVSKYPNVKFNPFI